MHQEKSKNNPFHWFDLVQDPRKIGPGFLAASKFEDQAACRSVRRIARSAASTTNSRSPNRTSAQCSIRQMTSTFNPKYSAASVLVFSFIKSSFTLSLNNFFYGTLWRIAAEKTSRDRMFFPYLCSRTQRYRYRGTGNYPEQRQCWLRRTLRRKAGKVVTKRELRRVWRKGEDEI